MPGHKSLFEEVCCPVFEKCYSTTRVLCINDIPIHHLEKLEFYTTVANILF